MAKLRLDLAKEEAENVDKGEPCIHQTSPSAFIQLGLDLEDQQYVHHFSLISGLILPI
jgi:hypothetical protein